jgi:hypothetical protein
MPIKTHEDENPAPQDHPHIGIPDLATGRIKGLPDGHPFLIIEDPRDPSGIHTLKIVSANRHKMVFRCHCNQGDRCTRKVVFTAKWSGVHPPQHIK